MRIAFQMDENINFETDTTFALIKEAQKRNHEIFIYVPNNLALNLNQPVALAQKVSADDSSFTSRKDVTINLNEIEIIFIRQNPPFDIRYITTTYILEKTNALVINNPTEIRNCPEKLITSLFPELTLPTLITENISMIRSFYHNHNKNIILKPLYNYGGNDVIRIKDESNIQVVAELMISKYECPVIAQAFCKNTDKDKRTLLLDGQPIGVMKRIPRASEEIRTNLQLGASFVPVEMNDRDNEICNKIGPELKKRGLIFVGIDIIDNFLLEINTTSPTGIVYINKLYNIALEKKLWDTFEEKVSSHTHHPNL
ncbi:glutathione synthase [Wolbachia endosymbiont of Dirofilaria (Dirofilaria) immitis]|uniref:glutathione synthase n=1 Tax=Wolbachia endosymbiont of Dirofilaria (Dirofilaria) immitis TaxID=1812115 RepID=UPI00158D5F70|nr:glutathione synthase [Wolbachia endosymbiont of Dirofilaria (Dirofilaria) immitis]QKX02354.1 glutathione synthase [Wolbachia endosymbiont of Dirofilaria (Dirofilaria) immitis]